MEKRMIDTYELIAPCHFGLESVLKREIYDLGYDIVKVEDGKGSPEKCGEPAESERAEDRGAALRPKAPGRGGDDPEGGGGSHGNLAVLYFAAREEDHDEVKEGNREI